MRSAGHPLSAVNVRGKMISFAVLVDELGLMCPPAAGVMVEAVPEVPEAVAVAERLAGSDIVS